MSRSQMWDGTTWVDMTGGIDDSRYLRTDGGNLMDADAKIAWNTGTDYILVQTNGNHLYVRNSIIRMALTDTVQFFRGPAGSTIFSLDDVGGYFGAAGQSVASDAWLKIGPTGPSLSGLAYVTPLDGEGFIPHSSGSVYLTADNLQGVVLRTYQGGTSYTDIATAQNAGLFMHSNPVYGQKNLNVEGTDAADYAEDATLQPGFASAATTIGNAAVLTIRSSNVRVAQLAIDKAGTKLWVRGIVGNGPAWGAWTLIGP